MKKQIIISALLSALLIPGCQTVNETLDAMSPEQFKSLTILVYDAAFIGGEELEDSTEPQTRATILQVVTTTKTAVETGNLPPTGDLLRMLASQMAGEINDPRLLLLLNDAINLVDTSVGQIRLGIGGELGDRSKTLTFALLDGFAAGLQ